MFCPKCGSILKASEGKIVCSCGYVHDKKIIIDMKDIKDIKKHADIQDIEIVEKEEPGSKLITT